MQKTFDEKESELQARAGQTKTRRKVKKIASSHP